METMNGLFGFCENGSGVFSCPHGKNPMYTYRECVVLGETNLPYLMVNQILRDLSREWPGNQYDLLARNCNHFCDEFCTRIGVPKLPAWVNRFANAGDAAVEAAETTALRFRQAKEEVITASKVAYRFLANVASPSSTPSISDSPRNQNRGWSRFQGTWFKDLISIGAKPLTRSSDLPDHLNESRQHYQS